MAPRLILFFAVLTAVVVALHVYVGWRILAPSRWGRRGRRRLRLVLALSALSILLTFLGGRLFDPSWWSHALAWVGFTAMGVIAILFALFLVRDVLFLLASLPGSLRRRPAPASAGAAAPRPSRRDVLLRASNVAVLGAGGILAAGSMVQARRAPVVETVRVPYPGLPSALDGFRIAQISDLHLGPTLGRSFLQDVVDRVNALRADAIAVTGDLVDGYVDDLRDTVEPFRDLRAPHGVYCVTGNHEYYWGAESWVDHLRGLGMDVLLNEHRVLRAGPATLLLAGVTDLSAASILPAHASDPVRALSGAPPADLKVLLAHQPRSLHGARRAGFDLQLSGHTHGGQIFPMNLLVHLAHPIVAGLGDFDPTWVYVNRGTAYWGPPMRTGARGEITLVELSRGARVRA